ncbi:MAG: hypothetical protein ABEJ95_03140 [Candidatus Nanohalobium sp.]
MKLGKLLFTILGTIPLISAHSNAGTPGIKLHHLPSWIWMILALGILSIVYVMYVKTHEKPVNLSNWR